jgi:serine/threonine protein kinase
MMTGIGMILGTAAYMSPEQAKGRPADKRSDVWAFGCVLYEMLTAKRAFEGEDVSDTLAFVITREPDWSALPPHTPVAVRKVLRRCLEKNRQRRLADIADAQFEIDEATQPAAAIEEARYAAIGSPVASVHRLLPWLIASVATAAAISAVVSRPKPAVPPLPLRMSVDLGVTVPLGDTEPSIAISPAARRLLSSATGPAGRVCISDTSTNSPLRASRARVEQSSRSSRPTDSQLPTLPMGS